MGLKVFILEDDLHLNKIIESYLIDRKYEVNKFFDGKSAIDEIYKREYDLYIIDIMVPQGNGLEILSEIRTITENPILIITALDGEDIEIDAFKNGTDDFIKKPFSPNKLMMRIEAILRRFNKINDNIIKYGEYSINLQDYSVKYKDEELNLLRKEFEILKILIQNKGNILSRERILDKVWGYDYFGSDRVVDAQVKNLRKKLKSDIIITVKGSGYKIN